MSANNSARCWRHLCRRRFLCRRQTLPTFLSVWTGGKTCKASGKASVKSPPSTYRQILANRPHAVAVAQPTVSKHLRQERVHNVGEESIDQLSGWHYGWSFRFRFILDLAISAEELGVEKWPQMRPRWVGITLRSVSEETYGISLHWLHCCCCICCTASNLTHTPARLNHGTMYTARNEVTSLHCWQRKQPYRTPTQIYCPPFWKVIFFW